MNRFDDDIQARNIPLDALFSDVLDLASRHAAATPFTAAELARRRRRIEQLAVLRQRGGARRRKKA